MTILGNCDATCSSFGSSSSSTLANHTVTRMLERGAVIRHAEHVEDGAALPLVVESKPWNGGSLATV